VVVVKAVFETIWLWTACWSSSWICRVNY